MTGTHSLIRLAARVAAAALTMAVLVVLVHPTGSGAQTTGTVPLNPAHVGATAEDFFDEGDCAGTEVAAGEALWHFVIPNNADFTSLTVTFQDAGTITLGPGDFGPPDDSHAFVTTGADDVLLSGTANFSTDGPSSPSFFNLSHTCIGEKVTTTTSPTTTPTTPTTPTTGPTPPTVVPSAQPATPVAGQPTFTG
jgi:hypothetical protein